ncbi:RrF2 family transcriptional regulator [Actinokineospora globicatena]|uniref:Rrf2 family transcriptional regulator n=1 Tax=Actinokineospora globicatena TaxID=103729 RepID=A0A9W6QMC1_9PSEU|nr:Rrf2 family transcriptional regulator [Actinokineospora globicatena]MCP2304120.1 transcriptional regulator, BadM/Rrf2 family [Actinokineospora globicatena]GLW78527.1 Rrf2 family transcriptional regulator [Actinokineospora globicatena]GLW84809.1 Rrf2 family transcriptional regulator [Actinokineospora globicatena]GLW91134.1 Rrf2 family transcriptional regulator [Actinokineospora globicatena]
MKLSNGVEWALHCCVSLSQAEHPVPTQRLAELHDVPPAYLAKHLQALARAGVVRSTQGQDGGYTLTRPAAEVTMLDVVAAIDGPAPFFRCTEIRQRGPLAADPSRCRTSCSVARAMADAEQAWRAALAAVTIADLATDINTTSGGEALTSVRTWLRAT